MSTAAAWIPGAPPAGQERSASGPFPIGRVFAIGAVAGAVGVAVGLLVGFGLYASTMASASPDDGWAELGAFVIALFGGAATGVVVYLVGVIVGVFVALPRGRRLWPALALVAAPLFFFISVFGSGVVGGAF